MLCHCDNVSVVVAINGSYCRNNYMVHMVRCLFFLEAKAAHILGVDNRLADAISRNQWQSKSRGVGEPPSKAGALNIRHLERLVKSIVDASLSPSTKKVYLSGQRLYLDYCRRVNCTPIPLSESQLCTFGRPGKINHWEVWFIAIKPVALYYTPFDWSLTMHHDSTNRLASNSTESSHKGENQKKASDCYCLLYIKAQNSYIGQTSSIS